MSVVLVLCLAICVLLSLFVYQKVRRPSNFPPGPMWLPVVGNLFYLKKLVKLHRYQHLVFSYLSQVYKSPVVGLKMGTELTVVLSAFQPIHQVLTQEEFEGRPKSFFITLRSMGTRKGITCTDGELWQEQRGFVVRHLRRLGYGRESMETMMLSELQDLKVCLDQSMTDDGIRLGPHLAKGVLNVLWTLVASSRLSKTNPYLDDLLQLLDKRSRVFDMGGGLLNQMPWLRFFVPKLIGYNLIVDINTRLKRLFMQIITDHQETYNTEETRDLIDAFLHQMYLNSDQENTTFTEDQLIMVCLDMLIAGSQTTSNTLDFAMLLMLLHPEVQKRVRDEILAVVGTERTPALGDRPNLPYVEAVLIEVQRLCHVTPIIGPRRVLRDTTLNGWTIPKNTIFLLNLHAVHMDVGHWGDPQVFRPERFLDEQGSLLADEWLLPFGLGRRRCLGEVLARSCTFLFFAGLLQHFEVSLPPSHKLPSLDPLCGITMAPQQYSVVLTPVHRSPEHSSNT